MGAIDPRRVPELLAPAGDHDCIRAAVENGADAVYFGLDVGFNARARATNFPLEGLPALMADLHRRGVRGYTTLNTLAFESELDGLAEVAAAVATAGVDAVLVQDVGAARLVRAVCPDLPLHASTQMTLTSAETFVLAEALGIERVVVPRELSVAEIARIRARSSVPLEVFVHGALCVAYSGQCLTSESLGGRSANRGQCAQACRLPYEVVCDDRPVDLGVQRYLLSPQDLAAHELVPALMAAGVAALKIEGRLKTPEYVAAITRHYRTAIDAAAAGHPAALDARDREEMEMVFSRGLSTGWLGGTDHKRLVPATSSAKRGMRIGTVTAVRHGRVEVELSGTIQRGDGVAFGGVADDPGTGPGGPQGGRVYEVFERGVSRADQVTTGRVELAFGREAIDFVAVAAGQALWKTDDPRITARLRATFTGPHPRRRRPVRMVVTAVAGKPLEVEATLAGPGEEVRITVASSEPLAVATRHPVDAALLRAQFGRLGGTPFILTDLEARIAGEPMVPLSVLGRVRHTVVERLGEAAVAVAPRPVDRAAAARLREAVAARRDAATVAAPPTLHLLCRSVEQVEAGLALGVHDLYAEFADIRRYADAVRLAHGAGATLFTATPRIHKPDENGIFTLLEKQRPDGILARNVAALDHFHARGVPVVGDFSLNVTNALTADHFLAAGCRRVTAAYDCDRDQLRTLAGAVPVAALEVVIHQRMPLFHMEHCVFCAVLSPGTDKTNCGRPCDDHAVRLRDRIGVEHPLSADVGCRNTLYNAVPQTAAEAVGELRAAGVCHLRVELLGESATEVATIVTAYRDLLAGRADGHAVRSRLGAMNRVGVTRGTLETRRDPLAII
ncbi:MAG: U32 family peptidase [Planctomycetia bacterium]|nr:U32 family peptidase [Planctomycetia bacterium]